MSLFTPARMVTQQTFTVMRGSGSWSHKGARSSDFASEASTCRCLRHHGIPTNCESVKPSFDGAGAELGGRGLEESARLWVQFPLLPKKEKRKFFSCQRRRRCREPFFPNVLKTLLFEITDLRSEQPLVSILEPDPTEKQPRFPTQVQSFRKGFFEHNSLYLS